MRSRNYTKEIGVTSTERPVPVVVAFVILAIVAVVAVLFVRRVAKSPSDHAVVTGEPDPVKVGSR